MHSTVLLQATTLRHRLDTTPGTMRLLDVRTPAEFETVHIPGADNVPLDRLGAQAPSISTTDVPIVLICRSGQRAERARTILQQAGVRQLAVLDGGLQAWLADGHEVIRGRARMSLDRQVRIVAGALSAVGAILALIVSPLFAIVPALVGGGLVYAGISDTCAMGSMLSRLPYNNQGPSDTARR